ncbi:zinc finger and BTB domain-containing protein 17-like isoform X2 [Corythoichthys intestinalis]|nr:zinc finger and BTB domain-containing protein 17-like isoform X2 [Corythoichthys intestinalis]
MSTIQPTRGELRGGVAFHLQCPLCGNFAKSHAHQLTHIAAAHPTFLDGVAVGRLGNIVMYQSGAQLFHCAECFFTSGDFNKLYQHIIAKHCVDETVATPGGVDGEDNGSEKGDKEEDEEAKEGEADVKEADEEVKEVDEGVKEGDEVKADEEAKEGDEEGKSDEDIKEAVEPVKDANDEDEMTPEEKRSSEGMTNEDCPSEKNICNTNESVFLFDGETYRCLICGWWKSRLKGLSVNHAARKHSIPREFAIQRIKQEDPASNSASTPKRHPSGGADEEDEDGLCGDLLKEEMEVTAKVVRYTSNRYVCLMCGWKTKMKGFAISHVVRSHDVERSYRCKDCSATFFLPSRLQQHMRTAHRPGRFTCPFCCFRSQILAGLRRHCSRCIAREEGEGLVLSEQGAGAVVIKEETKETRAGRKRARRLIEEGDDEDELPFF